MEQVCVATLTCDAVRRHAPHFDGPVERTTPIGETGAGLDSVACLELLLTLETETGCLLIGEDLSAESLATVGSLIDLIERRRGG